MVELSTELHAQAFHDGARSAIVRHRQRHDLIWVF
jgi:hypothetical protein